MEFDNTKTKVNERMIFDALENMEHHETDNFLEKIGIRKFHHIHVILCTLR